MRATLISTTTLLLSGGAAFLALGSAPAFAADPPLVFNYTTCKDGVCPSSNGPWLKATIEDLVVNNVTQGVTIKLESLLKNASEFFEGNNDNSQDPVGIAFNITTPIPTNIAGTCTAVTVNGTPSNGCLGGVPQFAITENGINLPGTEFQGFDLALYLAPPPEPAASNRFDGSDVIQFTLLNSDLSKSKFLATNTGGNYCSAARVGGLSNGASTVIGARCSDEPKPESVPAPLPLLGAAMAFGFSRHMRRRIHSSSHPSKAAIV